MRYRPFGRTGLEVSELVFGGGWVGGILIHQDDATRRTAIRRALEAGINWIDTAPSYGAGQSEEALGWLLQEVERAALSVDQGAPRPRPPRRHPGPGRGEPRAEPEAPALRLGRAVPAPQPDRAADLGRADRGRAGARQGRGRRRPRPGARAGPHPLHRDHRVRRRRGLPRGDRERPLRTPRRSTTTCSTRAPGRTCRRPGGATTCAA